jgi:cytochrome b6
MVQVRDQESRTTSRIASGIASRLPLFVSGLQFLRRKVIPDHKYTFLYLFGGAGLFLFFIQLATGMLLSLYYLPTIDGANESVSYVIREVEWGWLVRSIHSWGAHLMVATVIVHMLVTFFTKAYRAPREIMWSTGNVLFLIVLVFAFTGYLLPWDSTGYFATLIGTEIPRSLPIGGEIAVYILRGGLEVGEEALKRMYSIHAIILPIISVFFIGLHVLLQQSLGTSIPPGTKERSAGVRFFPDFLLRDILSWSMLFLALFGLSLVFPVGLGERVNPYASAPEGIKPEWYFLPLYQTLRMVPGQILGMTGEGLVNLGVMLLVITWFMIPWIDRGPIHGRVSQFLTRAGIAFVLYCVTAIALAYWS